MEDFLPLPGTYLTILVYVSPASEIQLPPLIVLSGLMYMFKFTMFFNFWDSLRIDDSSLFDDNLILIGRVFTTSSLPRRNMSLNSCSLIGTSIYSKIAPHFSRSVVKALPFSSKLFPISGTPKITIFNFLSFRSTLVEIFQIIVTNNFLFFHCCPPTLFL